jgi:rod shape-determining protein MreD
VSIYLLVPLLVVVTLLQTTIMPHLVIWGVFPDLPLLFVVCWGLLNGSREGMIWGFVAGIAVDLFSGAPFGAATLSLITAGFVSGLGEATVFRTHIALPLISAFLTTIVYGLCFLLIVQIAGDTVAWLDSLIRIILPSALLNAVLTLPLLALMHFLRARFSQEVEL